MNVRLTKEQKVTILNTTDIYNVMLSILLREHKIRRNQEHFWVVGLDNQNKILFIELIGLGTVNRVGADPPDVFRMGIYKLAVKMILVHNHPSGNLQPSQADLDFTDKMLKVGKLLNIDVIDHLVISEKAFISFADTGLMDELRQSGLFEIVERQKVELQDWQLEVEADRAKKENTLEIARKMKADGVDEKVIKKYTGLYLHEVRKL